MRIALFTGFLSALLAAQQPGVIIESFPVPPAARQPGGVIGIERAPVPQEAQQLNPEDACTVSGRVTNASTGEPLARASVNLFRFLQLRGGFGSAEGPRTYSATTDASGNFTISGVAPGTYRINVRRTGFVNTTTALGGGQSIQLSPGERLSDVRIAMTPHAVITGRVTSAEDGEPIEHAQVQALRYRYWAGGKQLVPHAHASTNDLGEYRLTGLAPGRYYIAASPQRMMGPLSPQGEDDFAPTYYPGTTDPGASAALSVSAGAQLANIDLRLPKRPSVSIKGRVSPMPEDAGRQRVMVMLRSRGDFPSNRPAMVTREGDFEIRGVAPGSYELIAMAGGPGRAGAAGLSARLTLEVGDTPIENLNVVLQPPFTVSGIVRVEGEDQSAASSLRLNLRPRSGMFNVAPPSGSVMEGNTFSFAAVPPGHYEIAISGLPEGYYLKSISAGGQNILTAGLDLSRGDPGPIEVVLGANAGQISGVVQSGGQEGVAGATVALVPQEEERKTGFHYYRNASSGDGGAFNFASLPPGSYKLYAWKEVEPNAYYDPDFLRPFDKAAATVTIREGSREDVKVRVIE